MATATATRPSTKKTTAPKSRKEEEIVLTLNLDDILLDPDLQVRAVPENNGAESGKERPPDAALETLAADISKQGQLMPVCVFEKKSDDGKGFCLVDGHRRYQALQLLHKKQIKAVVSDIREKDALKHAFTMNNCRKSLSTHDVMNAIMLAKKKGWSRNQIKEAFDIEKTHLDRYNHLLDSPAVIQEALEKKAINMAQALAILEVTKDDRSKVPNVLLNTKAEGYSAGKIKAKFGPDASKGRKPKKRKVYEKKDKDTIKFFSFTLRAKHGREHLKKMKEEIQRGVAALSTLLSRAE